MQRLPRCYLFFSPPFTIKNYSTLLVYTYTKFKFNVQNKLSQKNTFYHNPLKYRYLKDIQHTALSNVYQHYIFLYQNFRTQLSTKKKKSRKATALPRAANFPTITAQIAHKSRAKALPPPACVRLSKYRKLPLLLACAHLFRSSFFSLSPLSRCCCCRCRYTSIPSSSILSESETFLSHSISQKVRTYTPSALQATIHTPTLPCARHLHESTAP